MTHFVMREDIHPTTGLPQRADLGGYTILYVVSGTDTCLCARCASKFAASHDRPATGLVASTYDEGPAIECEGLPGDSGCDYGAEIESSYGDPDAQETP